MRSGKRRGVTLACGLACALAASILVGAPARSWAGDHHTIPRLVQAVDLNTGGPYYAPPIPYGHYVGKHQGKFAKIGGLLHGGLLHGHKSCGACGGKGCGACGGSGCADGDCGGGRGHGRGHGGLLGKHGQADGNAGCAGPGCNGGHAGGCAGSTLGGGGVGGGGVGCAGPGCAGLAGSGGSQGHGGLFHHGQGAGHASTIAPSGQGVAGPMVAPESFPAPQCGDPGCGLLGRSHRHKGCGLCGGRGCGGCAVADPCNGCGGKGCGLCGGGRGLGDPCNACGGKGCGLCGGKKLCGLCGGLGCNVCAKARGMVSHLLGHDKIKWFVGAGGPVPLTPGYTPYVITTRSPRDFLAFPPFTP